ncbi:hypothetical protein ANCDUO_00092 [Ancylostoma duodenale]|uniref:Uncharacterized protein n=1 Tax=Ancylostoma duodenale TaxID=51022 RepID=A0A0C2DHW4_9BILA|nr:hypothetical protein ANCDUO_00092 [Ancylostoma duodenale]
MEATQKKNKSTPYPGKIPMICVYDKNPVPGHVSQNEVVAKSAMNITVDRRRPRGRLKTRWLDRIEEDMRVLKLAEEDTFNRKKWRNHTRYADPSSWKYD